ncbi:hypothetical protein D9M68_543390 [compost metagenome]
MVDAHPEIGKDAEEEIEMTETGALQEPPATDSEEQNIDGDDVATPEIQHEGEPQESEAKKKPVFKADPSKAVKPSESSGKSPETLAGTEGEEIKEEPPKPVKKVDFEITNPDDIKIDDKGQLGFF